MTVVCEALTTEWVSTTVAGAGLAAEEPLDLGDEP
jgi:hypothetical protein